MYNGNRCFNDFTSIIIVHGLRTTLGFLADHGWIKVDAQAISIMTVLLFGAGTDYCLFLISRYREYLLEEGPELVEAIKSAIKAGYRSIDTAA
ncbi:MMPL family transporter, partial [Bacillus sp. SS-TM]